MGETLVTQATTFSAEPREIKGLASEMSARREEKGREENTPIPPNPEGLGVVALAVANATDDFALVETPPGKPGRRKRAVPPCPTDDLVALYHAKLPMLPQCMVLSPARKEHIATRWREVVAAERFDTAQGVEWFSWFFDRCAASKFLTGRRPGRNGGKPWRASLLWLMNPENFAKVIEGNYVDKETP
jgi:hypothetical protein